MKRSLKKIAGFGGGYRRTSRAIPRSCQGVLAALHRLAAFVQIALLKDGSPNTVQ